MFTEITNIAVNTVSAIPACCGGGGFGSLLLLLFGPLLLGLTALTFLAFVSSLHRFSPFLKNFFATAFVLAGALALLKYLLG